MKTLIIGIVALIALSGCDPQTASHTLKSCFAASEQTTLLRQLTAPPEIKEQFKSCRQTSDTLLHTTDRRGNAEGYCRALYFDANQAVQQCMKDAGYSFIDMDFYISRKENPYRIGDWEHGGELKEGMCTWEDYEEPKCYQPTLWFQMEHWRWAFREGKG
jgi:hypothetical protein